MDRTEEKQYGVIISAPAPHANPPVAITLTKPCGYFYPVAFCMPFNQLSYILGF